jgi:hypothetical protein
MPDRFYRLAIGEPKRLRLQWTRPLAGSAKQVRVWLDGQLLVDLAELSDFATVPLPEGPPLELRWVRRLDGSELHVSRAGLPVPGTAGDPQTRLGRLAAALYAVGGLTIVASALAELSHVEVFLIHGYGGASGIEGAIVAGLGFFVARGSRMALGLSITLIALQLVMSFASGMPPAASIVVHLALVAALGRGFSAIRDLEARAAALQLSV